MKPRRLSGGLSEFFDTAEIAALAWDSDVETKTTFWGTTGDNWYGERSGG